MKKGVIILGAGPMQVPAIRTAKGLGLFVIAADINPRAEGNVFADVAIETDIKDYVRLAAWAGKFREKYHISAVFPGADVAVTAAAINERLGLPGISFDVAAASNNKALMKQKWLSDGVPTPNAMEIRNRAEAVEASKRMGCPVIVKAIDSSASRGTKIVEIASDLAQAVENAKSHSTTDSCLIEEYVEGSEQSVETVMHNGTQLRCGIVDRHFGFFPFPVETGHTNPTLLPLDVQERIYKVVEQAALSLGITSGPAKADMILTGKGPMILEMAARLSGGFHSQYTTPLATGMNPIRAVIRQSLGDPDFASDLQVQKHHFARCEAVFPPPGRVLEVEGYERALQIPGVHRIFLFKHQGDIIRNYENCADRPCYVIVSADSRQELQSVMGKLKEVFHFHME